MAQNEWFSEMMRAGPVVMGVLNVTPDSFSDGGQFLSPENALARAQRMVADGARIIDVGGESSRPGAEPVSEQAELDRVVPVIELLSANLAGAYLSIDTYKPAVMVAACEAGAHMVNDIYALRQPGAVEAVARLNVPVCLMHMQGQPQTMQNQPSYLAEDDSGARVDGQALPAVVLQVRRFLEERLQVCADAGISSSQICLDPGFGFGKTLSDNMYLLQHLSALMVSDQSLLVGVSRKSMIGQLLGRPVGERVAGGLAIALKSLDLGAKIIRTHDVAETFDVLRIWQGLQQDPEAFRDL